MTEAERAAHLEWCRGFIEHYCLYRSPPDGRLLISREGVLNVWQYFLPVATLNQEFGQRTALLFWDHFAPGFKARPFQLCGCESGGLPLVCTLQAYAYEHGVAVHACEIKKKPKDFGIKNWLEGVVLPELPVLLVDDVVGRKRTMTTQAQRLVEMGLTLYPEAFCIATPKLDAGQHIEVAKEHSLALKTLFKHGDFTPLWESYVRKYGKTPRFHGSML